MIVSRKKIRGNYDNLKKTTSTNPCASVSEASLRKDLRSHYTKITLATGGGGGGVGSSIAATNSRYGNC